MWLLIIVMAGTFSAGPINKIGTYDTQASCEKARSIIIGDDTQFSRKLVLCVPIDHEIGK